MTKYSFNPFTGTLDDVTLDTTAGDLRYLKLDQTTPQTTVGTFTFPAVHGYGTAIAPIPVVDGFTVSEALSGAGYAYNDTVSYKIYPYYSYAGTRYYSSAYSFYSYQVTITEGGGSDISIDILRGANCDGIYILRDLNGGGYIDYIEIACDIIYYDSNSGWSTGGVPSPLDYTATAWLNYDDTGLGVMWSYYGDKDAYIGGRLSIGTTGLLSGINISNLIKLDTDYRRVQITNTYTSGMIYYNSERFIVGANDPFTGASDGALGGLYTEYLLTLGSELWKVVGRKHFENDWYELFATSNETRHVFSNPVYGNFGIGVATNASPSSKLHCQITADTTQTSAPVGMFITAVGTTAELTASSGVQTFSKIYPYLNQSSSAGYTVFEIDTYETAVGSGVKLLQQWKANNNIKLWLTAAGDLRLYTDSQKLQFGTGTDMEIYYDGTNGYVVTDLVGASDLKIDCGTAKTMQLVVPVYDEIQFQISSGKVPAANYPTWELMTATCSAYAFSVDDKIDCAATELPHWWVAGTAGDCHIHFTIKTAQSTGANRFAKFTVTFAYADINETWVETAKTAEYTIPTGTSALTHLYLDLGDLTLTNYLLGAQIQCHVKRIAATGGTEYADDVYIHQVGMHMQRDRLGSRQETTA